MEVATINDKEFSQFQNLIYNAAGISLSHAKKPLVSGRLAKRLRERCLTSYGDYFKLLTSGHEPEEFQTAEDLLTTNETYFFRESKHFDFMRHQVLANHRKGKPFRVWSAASSSGQEAYTIAMVLADALGDQPWEIWASSISIMGQLKSDGHLLIGHSESLNGAVDDLKQLMPSVYQKP